LLRDIKRRCRYALGQLRVGEVRSGRTSSDGDREGFEKGATRSRPAWSR